MQRFLAIPYVNQNLFKFMHVRDIITLRNAFPIPLMKLLPRLTYDDRLALIEYDTKHPIVQTFLAGGYNDFIHCRAADDNTLQGILLYFARERLYHDVDIIARYCMDVLPLQVTYRSFRFLFSVSILAEPFLWLEFCGREYSGFIDETQDYMDENVAGPIVYQDEMYIYRMLHIIFVYMYLFDLSTKTFLSLAKVEDFVSESTKQLLAASIFDHHGVTQIQYDEDDNFVSDLQCGFYELREWYGTADTNFQFLERHVNWQGIQDVHDMLMDLSTYEDTVEHEFMLRDKKSDFLQVHRAFMRMDMSDVVPLTETPAHFNSLFFLNRRRPLQV